MGTVNSGSVNLGSVNSGMGNWEMTNGLKEEASKMAFLRPLMFTSAN